MASITGVAATSISSVRQTQVCGGISCSQSVSFSIKGKSFPSQICCAAKRETVVKLSVSMCLGSNTNVPETEVNTTLKYTEDHPEIDGPAKLHPTSESVDGKLGSGMHNGKAVVLQPETGAMIHDFCLGIPFGGIVFGGGLFGFLFSKAPATSMLSGAAIMALGFMSLKVWKQGKSSLPFMFGQAAIAATLFLKHFQTYPVTKKFFPSGFYVLLSGAMLCFYTYVLLAGGNPPSKKKKLAASSS